MLAVFPEPYPDETLISLLARYKYLLGYENDQCVWLDLLGQTDVEPRCILLAPILVPLGDAFPSEWASYFRTIQSSQSFFNYLNYFNDESCQIDESKATTKTEVYKHFEGMRKLLGLAYCPICSERDAQICGEPYWHQVHQLPGVFVCPEHDVFLESSTSATPRHSSLQLPTKLIRANNAEHINMGIASHRLLRRIAKDSELILRNKLSSNTKKALKTYFQRGLVESRLSYNSKMPTKLLAETLTCTYSPDLLRTLDFRQHHEAHRSWLANFTTAGRPNFPLPTLLALYALGLSLDGFMHFERHVVDARQPVLNEGDIHPIENGLPIERLLGANINDPINIPDEVHKRFPNLMLLRYQKSKMVRNISVYAQDSNQDEALISSEIEKVIHNINSSGAAVSMNKISKSMSISLGKLTSLRRNYPAVDVLLKNALENSGDFTNSMQVAVAQQS